MTTFSSIKVWTLQVSFALGITAVGVQIAITLLFALIR